MSNAANNTEITEVRLRHALQTMANVIDHYGDAYWPIFDTLKVELDKLKARHERLAQFRTQPGFTTRQAHLTAQRSNITHIHERSR